MNKRSYKVIETFYNGYRFRSRTEARWAVFMKTLGVPYVYEKEGYDLGEFGWYLPDFWLPEQDCWVEIKPGRATEEERKKVMALAKHTGKIAFIFYECGPIINRSYFDDDMDMDLPSNCGHYFAPDGDWDGMIEFGVCFECHSVCIGHLGGHHIFCPEIYDYKGKCNGYGSAKHQRIINSYIAARSARFEHGEVNKQLW